MKKRQLFARISIAIGCLALFAFLIAGALLHWPWAGFDKPLYDWMQLLIIPVVLALVAVWFNRVDKKNELAIASDNQRENALQSYFDKMSELLLDKKLRESTEDDEVRNIARVHTLTVLPRLDAERKRSILQFLHESGLLKKDKCILNLTGANLSGVDLSYANLSGADLSGANLFLADLFLADLSYADLSYADLSYAKLSGADLSGANLFLAILLRANLVEANLVEANLREAKLSGADLSGADLKEAKLSGADLSYAKLSGANLFEADLREAILFKANLRGNESITTDQLDGAKLLQKAIMPDGSTHA